MNIDIRLPNITAPTAEWQMAQMQSYMHQLVQQLNWALNTVGEAQSGNTSNVVIDNAGDDITPQEAENTFNSIKALIIKSADIVKAYEETIMTNFNGEYFAESDFGTYLKETSGSIVQNSENITEAFTNIQTITNKDGNGTLDELSKDVRETNSYIKRGLLGYDENGYAIYGVEVGETTDDGAFKKYARFKSDRLSFFDANNDEVAYIGNGCLYILGTSRFIGDVYFGGYRADTSDGLAFTWIE